LIGPIGGIIKNAINTVDDIARDPWIFTPSGASNVKYALRQSAPQTFKQMFRAYDAVFKGDYLDRTGHPVLGKDRQQGLSTAAGISTLLGFTPRQVSKQRKFAFDDINRSKSEDKARAYVADAIARDIRSFETSQNVDGLMEARSRMMKFLDEQGGRQDVSSMVEAIQFAMARLDNPVLRSPSLKDSYRRRDLASSSPSVESLYQGDVQRALGELKVSQMLGLGDEVLKSLNALTQGLPRKMMFDRLTEAGVDPAYARLFSEMNTSNLNRLAELRQRQDPYLGELLGTQ